MRVGWSRWLRGARWEWSRWQRAARLRGARAQPAAPLEWAEAQRAARVDEAVVRRREYRVGAWGGACSGVSVAGYREVCAFGMDAPPNFGVRIIVGLRRMARGNLLVEKRE